jgi:hypothetical protein
LIIGEAVGFSQILAGARPDAHPGTSSHRDDGWTAVGISLILIFNNRIITIDIRFSKR